MAKLFPISIDPKREVILGTKTKLSLNSKVHPTIFVGTNVSGQLHLGHMVLFSIARALTDIFQTRFFVSLNEIESLYSHENNINDIHRNQKNITEFLNNNGCFVHSRIKDPDLILFATRLWKIILTDERKCSELAKFYKKKPSSVDILSVCFMAAAPLFVCLAERSKEVLMLYGEDQLPHLEFIFDLYKTSWFKKEVKQSLGSEVPNLNYLIIKLLPDLNNKSKMSKSRANKAISFSQIKDNTKLTEPILDYLENLIQIVGSTKTAMNNQWLSYISLMIF